MDKIKNKKQVRYFNSLSSHISKLRWLYVTSTDKEDEELMYDLIYCVKFFWNILDDDDLSSDITIDERMGYYSFLIVNGVDQEEYEEYFEE